MVSDSLLTELQRQQKYLDELPDDFEFPVFNTRRAILSQRSSGYRNTAAAGQEIVDNGIEAGANLIDVIIEADGKSGKRLVHSIAFIDNGSGMLSRMARYALTWGGGTHFDDPKFIGKFGFGLPNSSISQARRVEVYTRTAPSEPFSKTYLDIDELAVPFGLQSIPSPVDADLPDFVQHYLERNKIELDHGTVVLWTGLDRITYRTERKLKEHLLENFGITYRSLLVDSAPHLDLRVQGLSVQPVDPLFLMPQGRYYESPSEDLEAPKGGGAREILNNFIHVAYERNPETDETELRRVSQADLATIDPANHDLIAFGSMQVRLARLPLDFLGGDDDGRKRMAIRKGRRGIAFVRAGREIQTLNSFPSSTRSEADGLGRWPVLQSYALYYGLEVRFTPELDEVFGVTNDKQGVRPILSFWTVLADEEVDDKVKHEDNWHRKWREALRKERQQLEFEATEVPSPAELAARDADLARNSPPVVPDERLEEAQQGQEEAARRRARDKQEAIERAREIVKLEASRRPYRVDYYESEDGPFDKPVWEGPQTVIYVNRLHPFFTVLYQPVAGLPGGMHAKQAVDLLLISLGKAELKTEEQKLLWYQNERKNEWSKFLEFALQSLSQHLEVVPDGVPEEENVEEDSQPVAV